MARRVDRAPPVKAGFLPNDPHPAYGELDGIFDFLSSPPSFTPPPDDIPPPPMPLLGLVLLSTTWPEPVILGPANAELVVDLGMSDPPPPLPPPLEL